MPPSLTHRLQAIEQNYKQISALVQELKTFSVTDETTDERRLELATDIHERLKEWEDTLEILKQEVEDDSITAKRRPLASSPRPDRETEHEHNADLLARLQEDLKSARANFRRAQLHAKQESDAFKRQSREMLFSSRKASVEQGDSARKASKHEKLTQDEIALRAADDVTRALTRVYNQMEGELAQSQFAQQTLDESQNALKALDESYSGTTNLVKSSRGLIGQLVRSSKSDSWYLRSAWYMLIATISWLFFRRILYGPILLFIYYPIRIMWFTLSSVSTIMLGKSPTHAGNRAPPKPTLSVSMPVAGVSKQSAGRPPLSIELPAKGGGWDRPVVRERGEEQVESIIEEIERLTGVASTAIQESEDGSQESEEPARNTKKRMMEVDVEPSARSRDEL
ncbi:hypothetical protein LTR84_004642 [Exophiala bonariae]|uniref:Sec20 C-terminal domain-containing protein n=1 Tax=Exophiala bonariae TaxID=1690606 RepID=A0AAV9NR22_9EURO|nr:hypothetical protein LTR84_004642 [Exophiala bonariae]